MFSNFANRIKLLASHERVAAVTIHFKNFYARHPRISLIASILFATLVIVKCAGISFSHHHKPGVTVVLAQAKQSDVPVYLPALGTVTATYTVTVRTQINGQLLQVAFREGQMVKTGDLLAQIDPRSYQAQLVQYQGQLARDQATLQNAQLDFKRYQLLWKQNSIAKQTLDTQTSLVKQAEGNVKVDEGLIENTKLNLTYTQIKSPIDGRIGLRLVDAGNYIQTSDTNGIAVINTLNPITVIFTLPEDTLPQVMEQINSGKTLVVDAYDKQQNKLLASGKLLSIDNQIDPTNGTIKLKAIFDNEKQMLFPNQFVNIQLLVTTLSKATVIPTAAIQHGNENNFVYLVQDDQTVKVTPIKTGVVYDDLTVVTEGVKPADSIVIDGTDQLTDGASISLEEPATSDKHHRRHHQS